MVPLSTSALVIGITAAPLNRSKSSQPPTDTTFLQFAPNIPVVNVTPSQIQDILSDPKAKAGFLSTCGGH